MGEQSSLYQPIHVVLRDHLFAAAILLTVRPPFWGSFYESSSPILAFIRSATHRALPGREHRFFVI